MQNIFSNSTLCVIAVLSLFLFRLVFCSAIKYNCKASNSKHIKIYAGLSFLFPIIVGIICLCENRNIEKNKYFKKSIGYFVLSIVFFVCSVASFSCLLVNTYDDYANRYFDNQGNGYSYSSDVIFYDTENNYYKYDFDKYGYDRLYKNDTDEWLASDYCYLDDDGYLYYDEYVDIVANGSNSCIDKDGKLYYPAKYTTIDENGELSYSYSAYVYDRYGNGYATTYVPYYDKDGNKYIYSFSSETLKGVYTDVHTGETFENEYCFVDDNGYFVYDSECSFAKLENSQIYNNYVDDNGNNYFWASSVYWNENGNLFDSYNTQIN